jgi:hypothetical protein
MIAYNDDFALMLIVILASLPLLQCASPADARGGRLVLALVAPPEGFTE